MLKAAQKPKRFLGRKEYFGSLIYDRLRGEYIPFDWDATFIFEESQKYPIREVQNKLNGRISPQSFQTFVELCKSIELFDESGNFTGEFLGNKPVPHILSAPLKVHLALTYNCPLKCKHCYIETEERKLQELTLDEIKNLINQLSEMGVGEVTLGGSDPFLRDDLLEIISYIRSKNINVSISTTGIFVNRVLARKIAELGLKSIRVSFDGSTEKSYDYLREKGSYRKAIRGIKILRDLFGEIPMTMHSVISKYNLNEITSLLKMSQKLNCNTWALDFVKPLGQAKGGNQLLLTAEEAVSVINYVKKLSEHSSTPIEIPSLSHLTTRNWIYKGFGCVAGNIYAYISPAGGVKPCAFMQEDLKILNVKESPFIEIWKNSPLFQKTRSLIGNKTCKDCPHFKTCRGGCRFRAKLETNENAPDPYCAVINRQ